MATYAKYQPFLKRRGNRMQLVNYFFQYMPAKFNTYCEPFVGDGAILWALHPKQVLLNDADYELMNTYKMVKEQPAELTELVTQYLKHSNAAFYRQIRNVDRNPRAFETWSNLKRAARFIYLNQASFSGKWTKSWLLGFCNMAFNARANTQAVANLDTHVILNDGEYLKDHATLMSGDYEAALDKLKPGDLVYLAPPYVPISAVRMLKTRFTNQFSLVDQRHLAKVAKELVLKGVSVMVSNADVPMLRELYPETYFDIHSIPSIPIIDADDRLINDVNEALIVSKPQG